MVSPENDKIAVWVITPNGVRLAETLLRELTRADVYISKKIIEAPDDHLSFQNLSETLNHKFDQYDGHIFIMSTGIVVRVIAPFIKNKVVDPAVVVVDDQANHAISLLSGHLGGCQCLDAKNCGHHWGRSGDHHGNRREQGPGDRCAGKREEPFD